MPQAQKLIQGRISSIPEPYASQVMGLERYTPYAAPIYPPTWRGRYPHLMPADVAIWNRFLDLYPTMFLGFQYDVLLGRGALMPKNFSEADKALLYVLTVKRVDVLGIAAEGITLFEVKPRLGMAALGQCVAYRDLWHRHFGNIVNVHSAALVEMSEPDLEYVFTINDLQWLVV